MSERDVVSSPKPSPEPPQQTGVRIWRLWKIAASDPNEYMPAAGVYTYLENDMTYRHLANAAREKGDVVEEITAGNVTLGEERVGPTPMGDGFMARKPGEALFVRPKLTVSQALPTSSTYTPHPVDNPYLQRPATDYDKPA